MNRQNHLVQLIATLSPNEKRYFRLFSNIQSGNDKKYLQLFDALEGRQNYDAAELRKELGMSAAQLKDSKYYLTQTLLRSLCNSEESPAEMAIYREYLEACSLLDRRLFDYALTFVEKCIEKATHLELFLFLPNLISVKQTCLYGLQRHGEIPELSKQLRYYNMASAELFEITELRYMVTGFERMRRKDEIRNLVSPRVAKKNVKSFKSLKAQIAWFDIMTRYIMVSGTPQAFKKLIRSEVDCYEKNPQVKTIDPLSYVNSFAKMARAEMKIEAFEQALPWLEKYNALLSKGNLRISPEKMKALKLYGNYSMSLALRPLHRFEEALPFARKCCQELGEGYPYEEYSFTFEYAVVLFHTGHYKETADLLDKLLLLNTDMRSDLQLAVRPLMILTQYELGNKSIIPYLVKSAKAWLQRQKKSSPEADTFFRFMNAMAKATKPELATILHEFKITEEKELLDYLGGYNFNLPFWIERQIAGMKRNS